MNDDFERWLTEELNSGLGSMSPAPLAVKVFRGGAVRGRRLTLKAASLAFAAVLLTGGVALAAGTVVTGTPNPTAWGQQVSSKVETCKSQLQPGHHGIGKCVSDFAKQHGQGHGHHGHGQGAGPDESATPEPAESPEPGETPAVGAPTKHAPLATPSPSKPLH